MGSFSREFEDAPSELEHNKILLLSHIVKGHQSTYCFYIKRTLSYCFFLEVFAIHFNLSLRDRVKGQKTIWISIVLNNFAHPVPTTLSGKFRKENDVEERLNID